MVVLVCGRLPDSAIAANTVIFNVWGVLWSVFWGIGLATIVRAGKMMGRGDVHGAQLVIRVSLALSVAVNGVIAALCYVLRSRIARLFTASRDVIEILEHALPILSLLFFVGGVGWCACSSMEGMARNSERSWVYSATAWLLFVPGSVYLALYSPWRKRHKWSPICLIWGWALVVEVLRCALIWAILLRTDWHKQVARAKQRSEASEVKTSPKTRALIANDDDDEDDENRATACSLHEIPKDDYLRMN